MSGEITEIELVESKEIGIQHHMIEGRLEYQDGEYVLCDIPLGEETITVSVKDILRQYLGEEVRMVVLNLSEATAIAELLQGPHGTRDHSG